MQLSKLEVATTPKARFSDVDVETGEEQDVSRGEWITKLCTNILTQSRKKEHIKGKERTTTTTHCGNIEK